MEYMICENLDTEKLYALCDGKFCFWDKSKKNWYRSSYLAQEYEKAKAEDPQLSKEDFMQLDPLEPVDDWELPGTVLSALENIKSKLPCQCSTCTCTGCHEQCFGKCSDCGDPTTDCNSYQSDGVKFPSDNRDMPAETEIALDDPQDASAAEIAPAGNWTPGGGEWDDSESIAPAGQSAPAAFDYSGMDKQTVLDLQLAEREYNSGKKMAEIGLRRMAEGVAIAHDVLCGSCDNLSQLKHGNRGADTFGAWCESVGLNRKAAERLLNVAELFSKSSPNQQKILQELSPSLLYAAAKPSAPEVAVGRVKSGDIKTHKEYQQLLTRLKQTEAERDAALADVDGLYVQNSQLATHCGLLGKEADKAKAVMQQQAEEAEQREENLREELKKARAAQAGLKASYQTAHSNEEYQIARAQKLESDLADREAEVQQLKAQLAATPKTIEASAIDTDELERRAEAMANAKIEEENAKWTQMVEGLQKQVKQLQDGSDLPSKIGTAQALIDDILTGIEADLNWLPINQHKDLRIRCALDDLARSLQEFADNFSKNFEQIGGEKDG